jgi:hypothetical protein
MLNITQIPAPRIPLIDERTGLLSRQWYRFFYNLYVLTGGGTNAITLEELQLGPAVLDSQVAQLAVDLQGLAVGPVAQPETPPPAGTAVILSITDITPASTTGTAFSALVSSTVNTVRCGSRLKITINIVMTKATTAGTVTFNMLQGVTVLSTPFFSFAAGNGVTMAFTVYTAAINTPSSQAISIEWKRDSAGEVTSYASSTLEVTEVYQ